MSTDEPLPIVVDTHVRFPVTATPRPLAEALRRQLRQIAPSNRRGFTSASATSGPFSLLQQEADLFCLPQAMILRVTELCRRHHQAFVVTDRRSLVKVSPLRSKVSLSAAQQTALRQLLLRDSGVITAKHNETRWALTAEAIARRQQRTLIVAPTSQLLGLGAWLRDVLSLNPSDVSTGTFNPLAPTERLSLVPYEALHGEIERALSHAFGMIIFEGLAEVAPATVGRAIQAAGARYLLGLASRTLHADGEEGVLAAALGGVLAEVVEQQAQRGLKLACRRQLTPFAYPYSGRNQYQALLAALAHDAPRNRQIADDLHHELRGNHPCIVLSERRDHLELLRATLPPELQQQTDCLTSDVRLAERASIAEHFARGELMALFATSQLLEAADTIPLARASRLFITFPFAYERKLERLMARLLQPEPNKADVIVYDYDDVQVAPLHRACDKRLEVLARLQRVAHRQYLKWAQLELEL